MEEKNKEGEKTKRSIAKDMEGVPTEGQHNHKSLRQQVILAGNPRRLQVRIKNNSHFPLGAPGAVENMSIILAPVGCPEGEASTREIL